MGTQNRIQAVIRLVRQARKCKYLLREPTACRTQFGSYVLAKCHIAGFKSQVENRRHQGWNQGDPDHNQGPEPSRRKHGPTKEQKECQCGRHETPSQVVKYFPLRQYRKRVLPGLGPGIRRTTRHASQQPRGNLPVTPNPAVPTTYIGVVANRIFFIQLHVAQQCASRITAFEQIVTEDAVFRESPV